mmetsp:Transcript_23639/g.57274  ORF Transcript_23639/g.57274 Transcript_23639/m.57274 type:complete len:267 (+) Transcript_23639:284-1084(+)
MGINPTGPKKGETDQERREREQTNQKKKMLLQLVIDYWGFSTVPSPYLAPASVEFKSKFSKIFEQTKSEATDVSRIKHRMDEYYDAIFGTLGIHDCMNQEREGMTGLFIGYPEKNPPARCYCGGPNDTAHKYRLEQHLIVDTYRKLCQAAIDVEAHSLAIEKMLYGPTKIEDESPSEISQDPKKWGPKTLGEQVEGWIDSKGRSKLKNPLSTVFMKEGIDGKYFFSLDEKVLKKFLVKKLKLMQTSSRRSVVKRWKEIVAAGAENN